jgi:hypothetical protein
MALVTIKEIEDKFKEELKALLKKYNAVLQAQDHFQGYAECGEDVRMTIDIESIYDNDHNLVFEGGEIDLGGYFYP